MRICWVGWLGPNVNEISKGLEKYDPQLTYYIVGQTPHPALVKGMNVRIVNTKEALFNALQDYDIIFYDTYVFSMQDNPLIRAYLPGNGCVTQWPEWKELPAIKILFDGESAAGKEQWYRDHLQYFDKLITINPEMPGLLVYFGVDPKIYPDWGVSRHIKVLYSGDGLRSGYRGQISQLLGEDPKNVVQFHKTKFESWVFSLNCSKMYLATYSCASGARDPMGIKHKDAKALLCGALPLTEEYRPADQFLRPGKERITFSTAEDLREKIQYYDTHEDERLEIVAAGKKRVLEELTNDKMWAKIMAYVMEV